MIHPDIKPDSREFLVLCLDAMKKGPVRPFTDLDVTVRSEKLGLYGQLDKYDAQSGECTLTRCTAAPKTGCWAEDSFRVTALLFCIQESCAFSPPGMYIEYIPSGVVRYYEPSPKDRRRIFQILHQVRDVENGKIPSKPLQAPCEHCQYKDTCFENEPRRLSAFFKKG